MLKKVSLLSLVLILTLGLSMIVMAEDIEWVTADRIGHPDAEIVLTASIQRDSTARSPYDAQREYVIEAATAWAKKHPNVRIELQVPPAGEISEGMARLMTQAAAGNAPDFAHIDSFWLGNFVASGYLQPIDQFMTQKEMDSFYDFTKNVTMKDGRQYAIWAETDARFLHYRKDLIPEPPRTWEELIEIGKEIRAEHGIHGLVVAAGQWEGAANENTWPYFWAQGGQIFDETGRPVLGEGENRQYLINVFTFLRELVDTGVAPRMIASYTSLDPVMAEVQAENTAMIINGSWAVGQIRGLIPDADEKWDFAPYPQMTADQRANSNGGWTWGVFTDDPEKQALAFSFIWEVVGNANAMAERCIAYNYMPTRSDVYENFAYFKQDPVQQKFAEELQYGQARPAHVLYPTISDLVQQAVGQVLTGRATPERAVDDLQEKALMAWNDMDN